MKSRKRSFNDRDYKKLIMPVLVACATIYSTNTDAYNALIAQYLPSNMFAAVVPIITYATALFLK